MKKNRCICFLIICFFVFLSSVNSQSSSSVLSVDTSKSKVEWIARKITGKHNGFISITSGSLEMDGKTLTGGRFIVDTKSMTDVDVRSSLPNNWLMKHLKNDFFEVNKYPTASFIITSVTPNADKFDVVGKLTIKDSTQEIIFSSVINISNTSVNASALIKLDRRKFGIDYGSCLIKKMANKAIYNEFDLKITLVANK